MMFFCPSIAFLWFYFFLMKLTATERIHLSLKENTAPVVQSSAFCFYLNESLSLSFSHARTHTCTHSFSHARTHAHMQSIFLSCTHARTRTCTHTKILIAYAKQIHYRNSKSECMWHLLCFSAKDV